MSKTKNTLNSKDRVGHEHNIWLEESTLVFGSKVWKTRGGTNVASLFYPITTVPTQILSLKFEEPLFKHGPTMDLEVRSNEGVFWSPSFLDLDQLFCFQLLIATLLQWSESIHTHMLKRSGFLSSKVPPPLFVGKRWRQLSSHGRVEVA